MGRKYMRWTPEKDAELRRWWGKVPSRELAEMWGTTPAAAREHARAIGAAAKRTGWTPGQVQTLRLAYPSIGSACAPLVGRPRRSVQTKAGKLGLHVTRGMAAPDRERRRAALEAAAHCMRQGMGAEAMAEECAERCGCTAAMMRMVLPALLRDEIERRKRMEGCSDEG